MTNVLNKAPDIEVYFEFSNERKIYFKTGYCPVHRITQGYLTSGLQRYYGVPEVAPGGTAVGTISFITPEAYPHCLWVGKEIVFQEGERIKGKATVLRIFNDFLQVTSVNPLELYFQLWGHISREAVEYGLSREDGVPPFLSHKNVHEFINTNNLGRIDIDYKENGGEQFLLSCFKVCEKCKKDQIRSMWRPVIMLKILYESKSIYIFQLLLLQYRNMWEDFILQQAEVVQNAVREDVNDFFSGKKAVMIWKGCEEWLREWLYKHNKDTIFDR